MVIGVLEADGSTRVVAFGEAGPGARALSAEAVFEIGSISKVFTGTMLADMAARGEVALEDPVENYLPTGVTMPTRNGGDITLLHLATHRSSLPRLPDNLTPQDVSNPYADYTFAQMYDFLSEHELRRDIGSEAEYSNLAVGLLGHALARSANTSYETLVQERVLAPLGMDMSTITLSGDTEAWMARGHDAQGNVTSLWDIPTLAGAGAIRSNMDDMLVFLDANVGAPESDLQRAMRDAQQVRNEFGPGMVIGLNWITRTVGTDRVVWHNGGTGGFRSFIGFDPDRGVGAVVLTNSGHGADDIGFHLINPEMPLAPVPVPPQERVEIEVGEEILETYVGEYQLAPTFSIFVTLEGGALFAQATGQGKNPIFPESESEFFLRVVDAQLTFTKNDSGVVTGLILHQNGANQQAQKVGAPPVAGAPVERTEVEVAEAILETYVGEYELAPNFAITVTLVNGSLHTQATGQPTVPIFAESETGFFLRVVDAQLTFTKDESGDVSGLILHQNGANQPAKKVR
jgi:CubicO group peptidase (beta-lactamase class C family)